jgi:glycosyltransferase involved in cell wall biosynthesis
VATVGLTIAVPDRTGAAAMLVNFSTALRRRGHDVVVLHGPAPVDDDGHPRTILADLRASSVETRAVPRLRRPLPILAERDLARAACGVDVIVGFNQRDRATAARTAARLGIPAILAVQNQHNFWGPRPVPRLKRAFYRRAVRDHVALSICTAPVVRRELVDMGVEADRCVLLPNGVALGTPPPPRAGERVRAALGLDPADRVFLTVGRLDVQKGQDLLVEAWAAVGAGDRGGRLLVAGGCSEGAQAGPSAGFRSRLEAAIDRLGVGGSVRLLGWRDDVADLLAAADVFVHPARWEGWPLAALEAMVASRPVIMTDCSGIPDGHDRDRHGPVVPAGEIGPLGRAIGDALDLPLDRLAARGAGWRQLVERHYDIDRIGDRFVDLVEGTLRR